MSREWNDIACTHTWQELIDQAIKTNCWIRNADVPSPAYSGGVWFTPDELILYLKEKNITQDQYSDLMESGRWTVDDPLKYIKMMEDDLQKYNSSAYQFERKYNKWEKIQNGYSSDLKTIKALVECADD